MTLRNRYTPIPSLLATVCAALLSLLVMNAQAQQKQKTLNRTKWCVSDRIGLSFEGGSDPRQFDVAIDTRSRFYDAECNASIADEDGKLQFYLEARRPPEVPSRIFNAYNQVIPNSTGVLAIGEIANGATIVPVPGRPKAYYLFTLCVVDPGPNEEIHLFRTTVDMTDPRGRIEEKNAPMLQEKLVGKIGMVKHANGEDWWLLTHGYENDLFYVSKITAEGIEEPLRYQAGRPHTGFNVRTGELSISPDGTQIGLVTGNGMVELFYFDRCSGQVEQRAYIGVPNPPQEVPMNKSFVAFYGCSFSPSNGVFYYTTIDKLYQVDLTQEPLESKLIWEDSVMFVNTFAQHENGPDGRIYIARYNHQYLSYIENPDAKGKACNFRPNGLYLGGKVIKAGLPNLPNYNLPPESELDVPREVTLCGGRSAEIGLPVPRPGVTYSWQPTIAMENPYATLTEVNPMVTTVYTLTAYDGKRMPGCDTAQAAITVEVLPVTSPHCMYDLSTDDKRALPGEVRVYPNPARDFVDFELPGVGGPVRVNVYSADGRMVMSESLYSAKPQYRLTTEQLSGGVYFLNFFVRGKLFSVGRLIVLDGGAALERSYGSVYE